jgi:hypothetical protein
MESVTKTNETNTFMSIFDITKKCYTPSVPNYLTLSTKVFVSNWMTYLSAIQI